MIKVGIAGASSLTAEVLIKIILKHPMAELVYAESEHYNGKKLDEIHSSVMGETDLIFSKFNINEICKNCDVLFLTKDNGYAHLIAEKLKKSSIKVIDLSADFRIKNAAIHKKWYGFEHKSKKLLSEAVYGLPELYGEQIKKTWLVANPGCYPTSIILASAPLLKLNIVETQNICISSCSGVSGAGRNPKPGMNMFMDSYRNLFPYKVGEHRHTPEIEQELKEVAHAPVSVTFIPHLLPVDRGILSTIFFKIKNSISEKALIDVFKEFYVNSPFIKICPTGKFPALSNVISTNFCCIGARVDRTRGQLVVFSAIDNLIKGASGQAVQNMNIMFGLEEDSGLN